MNKSHFHRTQAYLIHITTWIYAQFMPIVSLVHNDDPEVYPHEMEKNFCPTHFIKFCTSEYLERKHVRMLVMLGQPLR
jgi:hypothetical protein